MSQCAVLLSQLGEAYGVLWASLRDLAGKLQEACVSAYADFVKAVSGAGTDQVRYWEEYKGYMVRLENSQRDYLSAVSQNLTSFNRDFGTIWSQADPATIDACCLAYVAELLRFTAGIAAANQLASPRRDARSQNLGTPPAQEKPQIRNAPTVTS